MVSLPMFVLQLSGSGYQPSNAAKVVPAVKPVAAAKEDIYIDLIETLDFSITNTGETTCTVRGVLNASNVTSEQKTISMQLNKYYSKLSGLLGIP